MTERRSNWNLALEEWLMPETNILYIYTTPPDCQVVLKPDSSAGITGVPGTYNGRGDGHKLVIPYDTGGEGAEIGISRDDYYSYKGRGLLVASNGSAQFYSDDFHLTPIPAPITPPVPEPIPGPPSNEPLDIINWVYASGQYNLYTKEGCGQFTEACCIELYNRNNNTWGHVAKSPGQNQYNNHAVDAVMCLGGQENGIWDIIFSSASSSAKPVYNRAGDIKPDLWRPHTPLPCQPA